MELQELGGDREPLTELVTKQQLLHLQKLCAKKRPNLWK